MGFNQQMFSETEHSAGPGISEILMAKPLTLTHPILTQAAGGKNFQGPSGADRTITFGCGPASQHSRASIAPSSSARAP
eukprot:SAG25_NODE_2349_length_1693_cov_2.232748_1_plen_78_part_10